MRTGRGRGSGMRGCRAAVRGGCDIPGPGRSPIHHSAWAIRPISPTRPQDRWCRADRQTVEFGTVSDRASGDREVTRKLVALVLGGLLLVGVTACMSTEESSVFLRINDLRAKSGQPALLPDSELVAKAQAQSAAMAAQGRLFHSTLRDGVTGNPRRMGRSEEG